MRAAFHPVLLGVLSKFMELLMQKLQKKVQSCFNRPGLASPEPGSKHKPFLFEAVY